MRVVRGLGGKPELRFGLEDLLDLDDRLLSPRADRIANWMKAYKVRSRVAGKKVAKDVCRMFIAMMYEDLLSLNAVYVFPERMGGAMRAAKLGDVSLWHSERLHPILGTGDVGIRVFLHPGKTRKGLQLYAVTPADWMVIRIAELESMGHTWE